jgi:hypothetical protein
MSPKGPPNSHKPFQPAIGRDDYSIRDAASTEAKTKGFVARAVIVIVALAIAVTGVYGLVTGHWSPVIGVWSIGGPLVGAVVFHYFGGHRKD